MPPGCAIYLLKDILHDWNDARALAILKAVRAASPTSLVEAASA